METNTPKGDIRETAEAGIREMPPLVHFDKDAGEEFAWAKSQVCQWMSKQPWFAELSLRQVFVWAQTRGLIRFEDKAWQGIGDDQPKQKAKPSGSKAPSNWGEAWPAKDKALACFGPSEDITQSEFRKRLKKVTGGVIGQWTCYHILTRLVAQGALKREGKFYIAPAPPDEVAEVEA